VRRRLVWLAVLIGLAVVPGAPARAESASARPEVEAWYATPVTCALPIGCAPGNGLPPIPRYPAGTLHIGVSAGFEDARSYVKLGISSLPSGATVTSASLTIPVAGADSGTASAETAQVVACFATSTITDSEGTFAAPPPADCSTTAAATYAPGPPAVLTVDLTPFAARWAEGEANNGIALLPAAAPAPGTTWHVAFAKGTATAAFQYSLASTPDASPAFEPEPVFDDRGSFVGLPLSGPISAAPRSSAAPIVDEAERPTGLAPVLSVGGPGFAYPVVFALPLLLLGLGGYLGWALNRPALPLSR
jgi:hypothetical protein